MNPNDIVIVYDLSKNPAGWFNYPKIGWSGILGNKYDEYSTEKNPLWVIRWDYGGEGGNLVYESMIRKVEETQSARLKRMGKI